jgi:hypothetical protein
MREIDAHDLDQVRQAVDRLLASGLVQMPLGRPAGKVLEPVPIHRPDGDEIAGWFVGIAMGDRLAGFLQLSPALTFRRYSSFQRHPPAIEGCPLVADWIDRSRILERARSRADQGETLADPFLSYDQNPDRLVWAVRTTYPDGRESAIYVAGDFIYRAGPGGGVGGL